MKIELVPMTVEDLEVYLTAVIPEYAQEHVDAGNWSSEGAVERARKEIESDLPNGLATEGQYLYTIVGPQTREKVGILWYGIRERENGKQAFVYDVIIDEPFRRRGYAVQAFQKMEELVKAEGVDAISLHVFGYNQGAKAMYEKLGFEITGIMMKKWL